MGVKRLPPQRSLKARALQYLAQREHSRLELLRKLLPHAEAEWATAADSGAETGAADAAGAVGAIGPKDEPATSPSTPRQRVEDVLDWLEAGHYLSAERFVESRLHARSARYGNLRIRQELAQHALTVPPELAASLRDSEFARAWAVWERRFATVGLRPVARTGKSMDDDAADAGDAWRCSPGDDGHQANRVDEGAGERQRRQGSASRLDAAAAGRARQSRFLASRGFSPEVIRQVLKRAGQPRDDDDADDGDGAPGDEALPRQPR